MVRRRNKSNIQERQRDEIFIEHIITVPKPRVYKRWMFFSSLVSLLFAWLFFRYCIDDAVLKANFSSFGDFIFRSGLLQYLPDVKFPDEMVGNITSIIKPFWANREYLEPNSPGHLMKNMGAKAHFPVLMIPGIVSTGLELWEGKECAKPYFRERLWGTLTMIRTILLDKECWLEHMKLDPSTGMDPEGVRMRPAQGLEAADFLMPGFWVWARIIENLAELGYDHNNLQMASYDWRLDLKRLELRDHYFSKLKTQIELMNKINGRKLVIIAHSLGSIVWYYFMKWVEADLRAEGGDIKGGQGGSKWIDTHIHSVVNIGGIFLGAPKVVSTFVSGEMRDTAQMGKLETYVMEFLLSKTERLKLFRTWMGGLGLLPKGGNLFWGTSKSFLVHFPKLLGDHNNNIKDSPGLNITIGLVNKNIQKKGLNPNIWFADDIPELIETHISSEVLSLAQEIYSLGYAKSMKETEKNDLDPSKWSNPLESRLPNAPNLTIYSFYGIGKDTERGYAYKDVSDFEDQELIMTLDTEMQEPTQRAYKGVYHVDGDGTIPLLSLGYLGVEGWVNYKHLNPFGVKSVVREYPDEKSNVRLTDVRGGPKSGDHVDILGNHEMTTDILWIVSNMASLDTSNGSLGNRITSNIREIAASIDLHKNK